ncbi:hypothetical protein [Ornithinibacillus xuwenensis]|uniref:Uncharacterized protein n=1 Tax=Ornithinibacillus xuwenensis TaxID=3144668 RepID=A0ABU9XHV6_9BACI
MEVYFYGDEWLQEQSKCYFIFLILFTMLLTTWFIDLSEVFIEDI